MFDRVTETLERDDLEQLQLERLREVVRRCYEHVPFYRERLRHSAAELLDSVADVRSLPLTTKADLRAGYPFGFLAVPRDRLVRLHASSGTKGKPTVVGYTQADVDVWAELCARALAAGGAQRGDVVHNAYGYGLFTGGLDL